MGNAGFDYKRINAAGSAVIKDFSTRIVGYHINSAYVGTVQLYDNAAGTSSANPITIGTPTATPFGQQLDIGFHRGCYYVASGTPDITLFYE